MEYNKFITNFTEAINNMIEHKIGCNYWWLETDNQNNNWAIVLGWSDGFEEDINDKLCNGSYHLCAKIAYQPKTSVMQCDYDIDWTMPVDEVTGDVWDTNVSINMGDDYKGVIDWLLGQFDEMKNRLQCWK